METNEMNQVAVNSEVVKNNDIASAKRSDIYQIDPRSVVVMEGFNVRRDFDLDELKEQIKAVGVLNPITVIPFKDENGEEKYRLVDGERRVRATLAAIAEGCEIKRIKANFLSRREKEENLLIQQMMRNEGKNFTEYECALMFERFRDNYGYTVTEIASKFGKKYAFVSRCLALLELAPEIQEKLEKNEISVTAVRNIVGQNKDDETAQVQAVKDSVDKAKKSGKKTATGKDTPIDTQIANLIHKAVNAIVKASAMANESTIDETTCGYLLEFAEVTKNLDRKIKASVEPRKVLEDTPDNVEASSEETENNAEESVQNELDKTA